MGAIHSPQAPTARTDKNFVSSIASGRERPKPCGGLEMRLDRCLNADLCPT